MNAAPASAGLRRRPPARRRRGRARGCREPNKRKKTKLEMEKHTQY